MGTKPGLKRIERPSGTQVGTALFVQACLVFTLYMICTSPYVNLIVWRIIIKGELPW